MRLDYTLRGVMYFGTFAKMLYSASNPQGDFCDGVELIGRSKLDRFLFRLTVDSPAAALRCISY